MKFSTNVLGFLPALAAASKVLLAIGPSSVTVGDKVEVEWLVDGKMSLELVLVKQTEYGWERVESLFEGVESEPCNGAYQWTVDDTYPTGLGYALWLDGQNIPEDGTGYADMTDWFEIKPKELR